MIAVLIAVTLGATVLLVPVRADPMYPCCLCGEPASVSLRIQNYVVQPNFEQQTAVEAGRRELIHALDLASMEAGEFRYTASFKGREGYVLDGINNQMAPSGYYWKLTSGEGANTRVLSTGLSHYVPRHGELITISLTQGTPP